METIFISYSYEDYLGLIQSKEALTQKPSIKKQLFFISQDQIPVSDLLLKSLIDLLEKHYSENVFLTNFITIITKKYFSQRRELYKLNKVKKNIILYKLYCQSSFFRIFNKYRNPNIIFYGKK